MSGRRADQHVRLPVTRQRWDAIAFLHWPFPVAVVQALVPDPLRVQELDGHAWVGITPFRMTDVRVPPLPPVPGWSTFAEVNVRTYVEAPSGTDGLWFLGLWCPRVGVVAALRAAGVPYRLWPGSLGVPGGDDGAAGPAGAGGRPADVLTAGAPVRYAGDGRYGRLRATVVPGPRVHDPSPWLDAVTGRWQAYTRRAGRVWRVPVEHRPWPLHEARLVDLDTDLWGRVGLPEPDGPPHVTWSPGVDARIGPPRFP